MEVPITREGTQAAGATLESSAKAASSTIKATDTSSCTCSHQQQTQSSAATQPRGHIIPIQVDATQEAQSPVQTHTTESSEMKLDDKSHVHTKVESAVKNISETIRRAQQADTTSEPGSPRPLFAPPSLRRRNIPINTSSLLPITKRGSFFNDDFFTSMRQDFHSALSDVLGRCGESSMPGNGRDALTTLDRYRQLRKRNLDVESQAMTVTADQSSHKVQ